MDINPFGYSLDLWRFNHKMNNAKRECRVKLLVIEPQLIFNMLTEGRREIQYSRFSSEVMPGDATFIGGGYDITTGNFYLVVGSETFEPVPLGSAPPYLQLLYQVECP